MVGGELVPKDGPRRSGEAFRKLIGTLFDKAALRLPRSRAPPSGIDLQPLRQSFYAELVRLKAFKTST